MVWRWLIEEFRIPSFKAGLDVFNPPFRDYGLVFVGESCPVAVFLEVIPSVGEGGFYHILNFFTDVFFCYILFDDDTAMTCRIDDVNAVGEFLLVLGYSPNSSHIFNDFGDDFVFTGCQE